jgi:tRNA(Ile)-lysidine synthase
VTARGTRARARSAAAHALEWRIAARLAAVLPEFPAVSLCVAFSGGLDSTVLLAALAALPEVRPRLRALHVDHGLQESSAVWAQHCCGVARALEVPLEVLTMRARRPRGASLEALARGWRYRLLAGHLRAGEVLLTAHHADDQLETVLLQLLRGAGLPGIAAMPVVAPFAHGRIVRPLLDIERAEIDSWARARRLTWIEDDSNADERLDRNYLRRRIVPLLRARWPGATRAVARTARHAAEGQELLNLLARADVARAADGAALRVAILRALDAPRRRNALRYWIASCGYPLPDTRRLHELAGTVLQARPDANPRVTWNGVTAQRHAERLTLSRTSARIVLEPLEWPLLAERSLELPAGIGRLELAPAALGPIDLAAMPPALTVRLRRGGERLRPLRAGPMRTLKSLLQAAHVPLAERERLPLLFDGARLIAAGDLWLDAAVQAGTTTTQRARLIWHRA